ncbi:MAG TPA: glycerol-3-phosphate 1-O-acyltransferase PlsY [Paracoccaceae bacterium]|nr:glycerol-3-phosphate 1-O-acyltransferase PlsY [Paracoccaceae bacterium]
MPAELASGDWSADGLALALVTGYLIGAIPVGVILARIFGLGDLRRIGSGNIGATNVLRTGNRRAAALTLVLDALKGAVAVLIFSPDLAAQAAAIGAMLGHCLSFWVGFRGGKGVATFLGIMLALAPLAGLAICATWLAGAALSRISSVGALAATAAAPLWLLLFGGREAVAMAILLAAWVWLRHAQNIARLLKGTEPRIGAGRQRPD